MILRPYQQRVVDKCQQALKKHNNTLLVSATGTGKTVMLSAITGKQVGRNGKRAAIIAHRDELTNQNSATFQSVNPNIPISFYTAAKKSWRGKVTFSMVQTLGRDENLMDMPELDLLVFDECFPAGTLVDGKPIETISIGDHILAYDDEKQIFKSKKVTHIFKRKYDGIFIRIQVKGFSLVCTPNHPLLTSQGWRRAVCIKKGDLLYVDQRQRSIVRKLSKTNTNKNKGKTGSIQKIWKTLLRQNLFKRISFKNIFKNNVSYKSQVCFRQDEKKQSDEKRRNQEESFKNVKRKRIQTKNSGWKWNRINNPAKNIIKLFSGSFNRICCTYRHRGQKKEASNLLQDRFSFFGFEIWDRIRRKFSQNINRTIKRYEKGSFFDWERVDNIEIQKQTGFGKPGKMLQDNYVYNLEVEDYHTYVANGIVVHNCHHVAANSYQKIITRARSLNPLVKILGVTATPERADNKGLLDTFDNVADIISTVQLIKTGHLVPPRAMVVDIGTQHKLSRVRKTANDYDMMEVEAIQNTTIHNNQIVEKWQETAQGRPSVAFCATIKHAEDVRDAFRDHGIVSETINGVLPMRERRAILAAFDRGEIQVLTNPMVLTEGWDCQICSCVLLLRTSSHKSTVVQMVGRSLRKIDPRRYPGVIKRDCKVLDFGISLLTHGDLDVDVNLRPSKESKEGSAKTKACPECCAELPLCVMECPLCGYEFRIDFDEYGEYDEAAEIRLIEIDLINKSPFRWISLFPSDKVSIASGFAAWVCVCSPDGENWFAIGGKEKDVELLTIANRIGAISSADDFMRQHETSRSAKKAAGWMNEPASNKQIETLAKFGSIQAMNKIEAAAHLTFRFNQERIERLMFN